ncbi:MAG: hypothetical protein ACLRS8_17745 [Parabacteroides merdae]
MNKRFSHFVGRHVPYRGLPSAARCSPAQPAIGRSRNLQGSYGVDVNW